MRRSFVGLVAALAIGGAGCDRGTNPKPAIVTVKTPESETVVSEVRVEPAGADTAGELERGPRGTWIYRTAALGAGRECTYKVTAQIQPNNYTTITRTRQIAVKGGDELTLDLATEDKEHDKIVIRWVPTPIDIVDRMAELAAIGKDDVVFDPGCGDAIMLIRPVKNRGAKRGIGIDIDPTMVRAARERAGAEGVAERIDIRAGDVLNETDMADCASATVVLVYMSDDVGARMSPVLRKLLKPGARVVSHRFTLGDWQPDKTISVKGADGNEYVLRLWVVKDKN